MADAEPKKSGRKWTPEQHANFSRTMAAKRKGPKRAKPNGADRSIARRNRPLEATALLRRAMKAIEAEVQGGRSLRPSDSYVMLALDELTGIKRE